jgi:hypothetical protein
MYPRAIILFLCCCSATKGFKINVGDGAGIKQIIQLNAVKNTILDHLTKEIILNEDQIFNHVLTYSNFISFSNTSEYIYLYFLIYSLYNIYKNNYKYKFIDKKIQIYNAVRKNTKYFLLVISFIFSKKIDNVF